MATPPRTSKRGPRKDVDWFIIRKEFERGTLPLHKIAEQFNVAHTSVSRRALKEGWVRGGVDRRIIVKAEEALIKRVGEVILTPEAIDEAVKTTVEVIRTHRTIAHNGRSLVASLMAHLINDTQRREEIEDEIALETKDDRNPIRRDRMLAAVSLSGHIDALKTLSIAAANFIKIEREAFGLESMSKGGEPVSEAPYDPDKEPASDAYRRMVA